MKNDNKAINELKEQLQLFNERMKSNRYSINMSWGFLTSLIFMILKLTGVIDWSWWVVTMPLWLPYALVISFFLIIIVIYLVLIIIQSIYEIIANR